MKIRAAILCTVLMSAASELLATSFVVPTDDEMVARSGAIVTGTVEGSYVQETDALIETVYEIRIDRSIKGIAKPGDLVSIVSPGGVRDDHGVIVPGAAHFDQGERVLLFLTREKGRWTPTDLTLGKFKFVTSTAGDKLLVRDMEDVVGWDHDGQMHHEKIRREDGFLRFLENRRLAPMEVEDYFVDSADVTLPAKEPQRRLISTEAAPFPAATYTAWVGGQPTRWPNMNAGVTFYKRVDQNISGAADGGVSTIRSGLTAWNNECASLINLIYGGTSPKASANFDGTNVVEFNDPQSRISGSWTGSGTVAVTFISFSSSHTFLNQSWLSITDADVVFQNGYTAGSSSFAPAMTHELGHAIGWRHSNQDYSTGGACNSSVEECTSAAIMNSSVNGNYGFTLQPFDVHAAESVYPGGSCGTPTCTVPAIGSQPASRTITSGNSTILTVSATGTAPLSYQWYRGTSGNTASPISGATSNSVSVAPTTTTTYWVRVTNACGSANSTTVTVTVTAPPPPPAGATRLRTDFNGDGRSDILMRNPSTGANQIWFVNGTTVTSKATMATLPSSWTPSAFGDFNGDGRSDIFWRNTSGANAVWLMNGTALTELGTSSAATSWTLVSSGDYNGDGRVDVFFRNTSTGANQIWYMTGATAKITTQATIPAAWKMAASGDFDGDGRSDILWRDPVTYRNVLWLMKSTGVQEIGTNSVASTWFVAGTGDFNADGRSDLFWRNSSSGGNVVWFMNGAGRTEVALPTIPTSWSLGVIGDFNTDGQYDMAWRNSSGSQAMWLIRNAIVTSETPLPGMAVGWGMYGVK